ncbi:MAG TPA: ROK family transcriptional regulator [Promineifilum sp.]|nr:ROK family transcriptional regulator [Promineifilum sp.]
MNKLQTKGQDLQKLRNSNLHILLTTIWKNSPVYRDELAKITGLAPSSVTRLINELIRLELVEETSKKEIKRGRSPQLLTPNRNAGYVISLDLDGNSLRAGVFDSANNAELVTEMGYRDFDSIPIGDQIIQTIHNLNDHPSVKGRNFLGVGISVPGIVNIHDGVVVDSFNLNLHDYPIRDILSSEFNKIVYIEHDASAAAAAEQYYGAGKGEDNFIYIMISNGIGSGVILNGNIYRGQTGRLGQLGHIVVNPNGQSCVCGQFGCLETVASVPAILANARRALAQWNKTDLDAMIGDDPERLNISILADAARKGNKLALRIFNKAAEHVAYAISIYVTLFDIHLVILGGELMKAGDMFLAMIRESLDRYLTTHRDIRVISNQLEENAFLRGVSLLTIKELLRFT